MDDEAGDTTIRLKTDGARFTVMVAVAFFVESATLVAVT